MTHILSNTVLYALWTPCCHNLTITDIIQQVNGYLEMICFGNEPSDRIEFGLIVETSNTKKNQAIKSNRSEADDLLSKMVVRKQTRPKIRALRAKTENG